MPVVVGQGVNLKPTITMKPLSRLKLHGYGRPLAALFGGESPSQPQFLLPRRYDRCPSHTVVSLQGQAPVACESQPVVPFKVLQSFLKVSLQLFNPQWLPRFINADI